MAQISGHKVPLLPLGPFAVNDVPLVDFFYFELRQIIIIVCTGLPHPTQQVNFLKKCAKQPLKSAEAVVPDWMDSLF
jgi:hypothetical protein